MWSFDRVERASYYCGVCRAVRGECAKLRMFPNKFLAMR